MLIDPYSTILFVLSASVNLVIAFFLQNYYTRKDYLCCGSMEYALTFRVIIYTNCLINSIGIWFTTEILVNTLMVVRAALAILMWVLYLTRGVMIYRHPLPKYVFIGLIVSYLCLTVGQLFDQIVFSLYLHRNKYDMVYAGVTLLPLTLLTFGLLTLIREKSLEQGG